MIRPRTLKRIKRKAPGSRNVTHFKKRSKPLFRLNPFIKKEKLKLKVRE